MNIVQRMILALSRRGLFDWMPDKSYLMIKYYACMGRKLNLKKPQSYSEKLQWLKLYNRKPEYTKMVDKYEVKEYVKNIIGEEYRNYVSMEDTRIGTKVREKGDLQVKYGFVVRVLVPQLKQKMIEDGIIK